MGEPPLEFPTTFLFTNVVTQSFTEATAGRVFRFAGDVTVRIDGDSGGVFSVVGLETLALRRDPELPPGTPPVWTTIATVSGAGPIHTGAAGALAITVGFAAPLNPPQNPITATAVVVAKDTTSPALLQIPIEASVNLTGGIGIVDVPTTVLLDGFKAGETADLKFLLESTMRRDVPGFFSLQPRGGIPFSSPGVGVTVPGRVDAGVKPVPVAIAVSCTAGAAPGRYDQVFFEFAATDGSVTSSIPMTLTVLAGRDVVVTTNLPHDLLLATGSSTLCKVTADDSGGLSVIAIQAGTVPKGISLEIGLAFPISLPVVPGGRQVDEVDVTINVAPNANLGPNPQPLTLNWVVPADNTHAAITSAINFNVRVLGIPLAPVDLFPANGAFVTTNRPALSFRDAGAGTPAAASQLEYLLTQNGAIVDQSGKLTGPLSTKGPTAPGNLTWPALVPQGVTVLTVQAKNALGAGPASTSAFTVQNPTPGPTPTPAPTKPPPPTPKPTPGPSTHTLTLQVTLSLPAFTQTITNAVWTVTGPGTPASAIPGSLNGSSSAVAVPLPQSAGGYAVSATVDFSYTALVANGGIYDDSAQVQSPSQPIPWSGQSVVARFVITFDASTNHFNWRFDGLFGS